MMDSRPAEIGRFSTENRLVCRSDGPAESQALGAGRSQAVGVFLGSSFCFFLTLVLRWVRT
jgi:hypothetical protein